MREIKFRGKKISNGRWVHGYLTGAENDYAVIEYDNEDGRYNHLVYANTVGQYTGLKDANGKEIYEGDLVKNSFGNSVFGMVAWNTNGYFYIMETLFINNDYGEQDHRPLGEMLKLSIDGRPCNFTVVGNIHDNTELIEK